METISIQYVLLYVLPIEYNDKIHITVKERDQDEESQ